MKQLQEPSVATVQRGVSTQDGGSPSRTQLPLWRVNVLRGGYLVVGGGGAAFFWPRLVDHASWGLAEGTVQCLLVAMSALALLGLLHPVRMLPILLFEVGWKALWLGIVALPLWSDGRLEGAASDQLGRVLWVVVVVAVIPWRYVLAQYAVGRGEPWRRR